MPPPEDGMTGLAAVVVAPPASTTAGVGLRLPRRHLLPRGEEHPRPGVDERAGPAGLPAHVLHQFRGGRAAARGAAGTRPPRRVGGGRPRSPLGFPTGPPTSGTPPATLGTRPRPAGSPSVAMACRSTCPAPTTTRGPSSAPWTGRAARATTTTSSAWAEQMPGRAPYYGAPEIFRFHVGTRRYFIQDPATAALRGGHERDRSRRHRPQVRPCFLIHAARRRLHCANWMRAS